MAKSTAATAWQQKLELYEKLVATNPNVERRGAIVPCTSLNGHMFSYLSKEGKLELRLPRDEREAFLKKYKARLCEALFRLVLLGPNRTLQGRIRKKPRTSR